MNAWLRSLTPSQQVGALFLIVFGLLFLASALTFLVQFRAASADKDDAWHDALRDFRALLLNASTLRS